MDDKAEKAIAQERQETKAGMDSIRNEYLKEKAKMLADSGQGANGGGKIDDAIDELHRRKARWN